MSEDERHFLMSLQQPQARFTVEQTAWVLNFQCYEILSLVSLGLLSPIGDPAANAIKYFYAQEILELAKNKSFLKRATNAMYQARLKKNRRQKEMQKGSDGKAPALLGLQANRSNGHV
jgi:hypothetical protein